jgi:hypothetical protein
MKEYVSRGFGDNSSRDVLRNRTYYLSHDSSIYWLRVFLYNLPSRVNIHQAKQKAIYPSPQNVLVHLVKSVYHCLVN